MEKRCSKCGLVKPVREFYAKASGKFGVMGHCKECCHKVSAARYAREKKEDNARSAAWRKRNAAYLREFELHRDYGLTVAQYEALFWSQGGVCKICCKPETVKESRTGATRQLAVDHCHATGQVRGLLCVRCNTALGKIEQVPEGIIRFQEYLGM